jgi:hypothetical protein
MAEQLTETVQVRFPKALKEKAIRRARSLGLDLSSFLRHITILHVDPDAEQLRLVDSKERYEVK